MGLFGNPISKIKSVYSKAVQLATRAVRQEDQALVLEGQEEREQAKEKGELGAFFSSMKRETGLMKDLTSLESTKYSLVRGLNAFDAAKRNVSEAKKRVMGIIDRGGRKIANLTRAQALRGGVQAAKGVAAVARGGMRPGMGAGEEGPRVDTEKWSVNINRYEEINKKHLQLLANDIAAQIAENRQEEAKENRLIEKNGEISKKLQEFVSLISQQTDKLESARKDLENEIRLERRELRSEQLGVISDLRAAGEDELVEKYYSRRR